MRGAPHSGLSTLIRRISARSSASIWGRPPIAGFPTPVMAKAGPMPTHQGLRSDDSDGPEHRWKPSIQQNQEQAIPICELDATPHPALQHNQLMTERRVLGLKSALRLERRDGQGQKEAEERDHRR